MDLPFFSEGKKPRKWQDLRVTTFLAAMTFLQVERALDAEKCMRQRTHGGYSTGNTVPSRRLDKVEKLGRVDMRRKKAEITSTTQVIPASSRRGHPPKVDRVFTFWLPLSAFRILIR